MEERDDAQHVDLDVLDDVGALDLPGEWEHRRDGGVGDHDIEVRDAVLLLQFADDIESALLDSRFVLGRDQDAVGALGKVR